jgi:hypothetical protein
MEDTFDAASVPQIDIGITEGDRASIAAGLAFPAAQRGGDVTP